MLPDGALAPDNAALVRAAAVLTAVGASRGHFAYESGHHGDLWLDLDSLFLDPGRTDRFAAALAARLEPLALDAVCGPLVGGALLAQAVGAQLGVDLLYAERQRPRYRLPNAVRPTPPADARDRRRRRQRGLGDPRDARGADRRRRAVPWRSRRC